MGNGIRDDFSAKTINNLKLRAAFICSNPSCKCLTVAPSEAENDKVLFNGVGSHICAAAPGGPRYKATMTFEERGSIENAIFLCSNCSVTIDKNNGADFSEATLLGWKRDHEHWVRANLNKRLDNQASNVTYNVNSYGQTGGITAAVVNIGAQQRRLSPDIISFLDSNFRDPSERIIVSHVQGNNEALNLAEEIKQYLNSKGFNMNGHASFERNPPVYGLKIESNDRINPLIRGNGNRMRTLLVGYIPKA